MRFRLTVLSERGGVQLLDVEAQSEAAAAQQASAQGASVLSVQPERAWTGAMQWRRKAFPLLLLCQELLALLRAGISVVEAYETLAEKEQVPETRSILERILDDLRSGKSLSSALEGFADAFPPLLVAAVRASERTGNLEDALARFVTYRLQLETARKKVVTALVYPVLLLGVAGLVTLFLLVYVVPRFSRIFEDRMADIPLLTRLLIGWGSFLNDHPWQAALAALLALAGGAYAVTRPGAKALVFMALRALPKVGAHVRVFQLARLYRTLGMLLKSGLPVVTGLGMVRGLMDPSMRPAFDLATSRIREGTPISVSMTESGLTTPVAARMLRVGERTGNMAQMMERLAEFYDDDNTRALELFSRTFEPLLMALIGLVIGAIVVVMYLPIFDLAANIR